MSRCTAFSATMAAVAAATRATSAPLAHLRVLDLSRVLAGRPCDRGRSDTGPAGANGLPNQVVVRVGRRALGDAAAGRYLSRRTLATSWQTLT